MLKSWRIPVRQIGYDIGRSGMKDKEIITLLHSLNKTTFFTRDSDFFDPALRHANYCLININVNKNEAAMFIRHILRHPAFNTAAKRMGKVIRGTNEGVYIWQLHAEQQEKLIWRAI
jgi:hypothetical protein